MQQEELDIRFTYHPPTPEQREFYEKFREHGKLFAEYLNESVPDCREKSEAINYIEHAVMWGNAAMARRT